MKVEGDLEFSDELVDCVFVDDGFGFDALGSVGVAQCGQRFVVVDVCRRQSRYHHRLAVCLHHIRTSIESIHRLGWVESGWLCFWTKIDARDQ